MSRPPHDRRPRSRGSRCRVTAPLAVLLAAAVLAAAPAQATRGVAVSNPELYGKSLGAAHEAIEQFGVYDDAAELERVADVAYRLAAESGYVDFPFSFYLIDMPEPNAFALPGGQIFVTRGMLNLGLSDDMLACLLGHEIAHVTNRHGLRMQRRATWLNILSQAALLGVMIGVKDEPENPRDPYGIDYSGSRKGSLVQGTAAAGVALSELLLRDYSRDFEDEADVEGQRMAAAAGFDPDGARQLWELMNQRIPQSREYGYWRTHPFSDQRMRAAEVRAKELKVQEGGSADAFRAATQNVLIQYGERDNPKPELLPFIETSALTAWPRGERAEELRLTALHRRRDTELTKKELERDYGALIAEYGEQIDAVQRLTPESRFLARLAGERDKLRAESDALYPKALAVWEEGIVQTPFLETFLSNYPQAEVVPAVALALGNAYSRLGRQAEGVKMYLRAAEAGPDSTAGQQALTGLRNLAPALEDLAALQELHDNIADPTLRELAQQRLGELAPTYAEIANGAEYLRQYPESDLVEPVRTRLEGLAQNLYGEVVLYQELGDHLKALERIQQILTHAPQSPAAAALRERATVVKS